ncbi:MAG: tetratricopeptide repeat protein [Singulisphaera sp.]
MQPGWTIKLWDAPWTPEGRRVEQQALALLDGLFARPLGRAVVGAHLRSAPTIAAEVRSRALALLERYREETRPEAYHQASWAVARQPYLNAFQYDFALRQAETACRLAPDQGKYRTTLGVAQYRAGQYRTALATLERAGRLSPDSPVVLAFLAMAHGRLDEKEQAHEALGDCEQVPQARGPRTRRRPPSSGGGGPGTAVVSTRF